MRKRRSSSSEFSSEDDTPVNLLIAARNTASRKKDLYKFRVEKCEFCDDVFYNKYDILVHNASHIIIPLMKPSIFQCTTCQRYFPTNKELYIHKEIYHHKIVPDLLHSIVTKKPIVKCENIVSDLINLTTKQTLGDFVKKEPIVQCETTVTDLIHLTVERTLGDFVNKEAVVKCDDTVTELIMESNERKLEKIIKKEAIVKCDNVFNELIMENKSTIIKTEEEDTLENDEDMLENEEDLLENDEHTLENEEDLLENGEDLLENDEDTLENEEDMLENDEDLLENDEDKLENDEKDTLDDVKDECDNSIICIEEFNYSEPQEPSNIKARLVFEDDLDDLDDIINLNDDFDCEMNNINNDNNEATLDLGKQKETFSGKMILGSKVNGCTKLPPSVHYEDLIVPSKRYSCQICHVSFRNRFDQLVHKATHLRIKPPRRPPVCPLCDYYIAGNYRTLRQHMETKHPQHLIRHYNLNICKKCNLKYKNIFKHMHNYHLLYICPVCSHRFEREKERDSHMATCKREVREREDKKREEMFGTDSRLEISKTIKVCEVCSLFQKNSSRLKYLIVGDYCEEGVKVSCDRCEKKFLEVKLVKITRKETLQGNWQSAKKTPISNEDRLKKFRKKLKMLNR